MCLFSGFIAGCSLVVPRPSVQTIAPERLDYAGYQKTIAAYACDGLVRYKKLKTDTRELDEFIISLANVGPRSTPNLFIDEKSTLAFWINVYNAASLRAAVEKYPTSSVQTRWENFEEHYRVQVDGKELTLAQIAGFARQAGHNDPRIELALTLPAKGSPKFSSEVYQASQINQQLDQALSRALEDPNQVTIDHGTKTLRLGSAIYRVQDKFIQMYCRKYKTTDASIINVLADYGNETQRRRLNAAIGYGVAEVPFDWSLNEKEEPPCSLQP
jgi:hypothetical protein